MPKQAFLIFFGEDDIPVTSVLLPMPRRVSNSIPVGELISKMGNVDVANVSACYILVCSLVHCLTMRLVGRARFGRKLKSYVGRSSLRSGNSYLTRP